MGTEVTRWYGGGIGGHVGLMDNIMSESLNRASGPGELYFFGSPPINSSYSFGFSSSFYTHRCCRRGRSGRRRRRSRSRTSYLIFFFFV